MHGRKKVSIDEAHKIKLQRKAKMLKDLYEKAMIARADPEASAELIQSGTPILDHLDDFATLWNMRKQSIPSEPTAEQIAGELEISLRVLKCNPKSYWAWHHRRWCIELIADYDCHKEVEICDAFLSHDCRNFHAWRHRRWAVGKCTDLYESELQKTYDMISSEFSNFSAWHYRSQLPNLTDLRAEIDLTKNAFWTDPNDQSSWIYYRWLLNHEEISSDKELIEEELAGMCELMQDEPESKYPCLAAIWLERKRENPDEENIRALKDKLAELDPIRSPYYEEQ